MRKAGTHMKRVYCLYRVSTSKQLEKDDIPMQKQACREFAEQQGWTIVNESFEKGISGFKVSAKNRDEIQNIQKAAVEKKFDILLVFMFDRIGRITEETPFLVEWFVKNGIEVWSVNEGQRRLESEVDKLMNIIYYWQASGESIKTSVRTKTRMGQIVQEGRYRGGTAPYGYQLIKKGRLNKKGQEINDIEVNPYEAEYVKQIFYKYVYEGYGIHRIINYLADNGINNHNGKRFSFSSIRCIIQNPIYIGILKSGEILSEPFPNLQIIDNDMFEQAQKLRIERSNEHEEMRRLPLNTKGQSLLSGNIFCGHCGGRLCLTTNGKAYKKADGTIVKNKRIRYICYNKTRKICDCDGQTGYTMKKLDGIIIEFISNLFQNIKGASKSELIEKSYQTELTSYMIKLKGAKADLQKQTDSLKLLQDEVVKSIQGESKFTPELLNELIAQIRDKVETAKIEVQKYESELENKQQYLTAIKINYENLINWSEIFQNSNSETKKMITAYLIESVKVSRDYELDIKFNLSYEQFFIIN